MTTRAIHLELAQDMSSSSFINVLRRFVARRGSPKHIYSDLSFFSFRPFPLVRGGHSVSSFSTSFCLQHPSPSHQLPLYLPSLHLKIFSLVSLFFSFPVTPFPSFFFYILLVSPHDMSIPPQPALHHLHS